MTPTLATSFAGACTAFAGHRAVIGPGGDSATYAELDARCNQVVHFLGTRDIGTGDRVGVMLPKSIDTVAIILGIMRAGAAYVPVDPHGPVERAETILADCGASITFTQREIAASTATPEDLDDQPTEPIAPPTLTGDDLAYILYTSGSTGTPKGVPITHRNAMSFCTWCRDAFNPEPADVFSSHAPFHFDLSILDLHVSLAAGAALALIDEASARDPRRLAAFIAERGITVWYSVPSILAMMAEHGRLDEHASDQLRLVLFAGEVFPVRPLNMLREAWPGATYWNLYGPTETNVCTAYRLDDSIDRERTAPYPIGPACAHCASVVIDAGGNVVSEPGSTGRLLIAGDSVMTGYWNADSASVFHEVGGIRYYDTGDLVEIMPTGSYLFRGRADRMIKRRGYRIEPAEVEAGLLRHPLIREAAVFALENEHGVTMVAAIGTEEPGGLGVIALKRHCAEALPDSMVPDRFQVLEALPRTSTGKVDFEVLRGGA